MARMPSFNKFLTVNFNEFLQIPPAFLRDFDGVFPQKVSLWTPTGGPWDVVVTKIENNSFFGKGWSEFVQEHHLKSDDSLVFTYDRNSNFHVSIYGTDGCEKDVSNVARNGGNRVVGKTSSRADDVISMESQNKMDKRGSKESNGNKANLVRPMVDDDVVLIEDLDEIAKCSKKGKKDLDEIAKCSKKGKKAQLQSKSVIDSGCLVQESRGDEVEGLKPTTKRTMRARDKTKARYKAQHFKSENPFFVVIMQPSYITGRNLTIPTSFSSKYFSETEKNVILRASNGRSWSAKGIYKVYDTGVASQLQCGWCAFVRANNLKVGDVCVFELVNVSEMCFEVVKF